jgi:hypothetical protein
VRKGRALAPGLFVLFHFARPARCNAARAPFGESIALREPCSARRSSALLRRRTSGIRFMRPQSVGCDEAPASRATLSSHAGTVGG